jgi:NADH:ubiquinone oxidoreductase subunit E
LCSNKYAEEKYNELEKFIDDLEEKEGALITILHRAQNIFGYLPMEVQLFISRKLAIPAADVNGVVTFYSYFTQEQKGKHVINVCLGTACFVRGASKIIEKLESELKIKLGETSEDGSFSMDALRCVGACGLAPVIMIDGKVFGRVEPDKIPNILEDYR